MKISIIGSNGMLSKFLTEKFMENKNEVNVFGLDAPKDYKCTNFIQKNLITDKIDYDIIIKSNLIIYAAGAGVQAALKSESSLMYALNVSIPIEITIQLKKLNFNGIYISFGSYMEIGLNDEEKAFTEEEVICSPLQVTNDYALSKRLYGRYMNDFHAEYIHWHFILPNMFSEEDLKPGTRLVPYVLKYLQDYQSGRPTEIPSYSAGTQTRQYIALEEVLVVIKKSIEKSIPSGIYCIGGGEFLSIRNLIESLYKIYKVPCKDEYFGKEIRRDGDIKSLRICGDKLKRVIDYLPDGTIETIFNPNK